MRNRGTQRVAAGKWALYVSPLQGAMANVRTLTINVITALRVAIETAVQLQSELFARHVAQLWDLRCRAAADPQHRRD